MNIARCYSGNESKETCSSKPKGRELCRSNKSSYAKLTWSRKLRFGHKTTHFKHDAIRGSEMMD